MSVNSPNDDCPECHACVSVQGSDSVITDVIIQNEKDVPPPGYTLIERTLDSSLFLFHSVLYIANHKKMCHFVFDYNNGYS